MIFTSTRVTPFFDSFPLGVNISPIGGRAAPLVNPGPEGRPLKFRPQTNRTAKMVSSHAVGISKRGYYLTYLSECLDDGTFREPATKRWEEATKVNSAAKAD